MITKFKHKLRMAGLEDKLHHQLGLRPGMAVWMTRMAWDIAAQRNVDLLAYRGDALLAQFVQLLESSSYRNLLRMAADSSEAFAEYLAKAHGEDSTAVAVEAERAAA
jgi:hypothetical protein